MSQITDEQVAVARNAWKAHKGDNEEAMRAALEAAFPLSTPPVGAETAEPVAWLHEPTGNVFKDGECQALIKAWQKQFADTMPPEEIAADFVPLVRTSPAVPNTVGVDNWQDIATAPKDGTAFQARIPGHGSDNIIAWSDGLMNEAGDDCGGWQFVEDQEPPDDWTDGVCWAVNENGVPSTAPTHWKPLPASLVSQEAGE